MDIDRLGIADLFARWARMLDEQRFDDSPAIFTDDVTVHSPRAGELRGIDAVTGFLRESHVAGEQTQHMTTDLIVETDGDAVRTSANSLVHFFRDGEAPHQTSGVRLTGTVVRNRTTWRFSEVRITRAWTHAR